MSALTLKKQLIYSYKPLTRSSLLSKIILHGHILVSDTDLKIVKNELVIHTRLTQAEPGCLIFRVTPDPNNPNKFEVYEEFINQSAFDNHQARVKESNWGKVTKKVQRHYQLSYDA